jgi:hypothetical protein
MSGESETVKSFQSKYDRQSLLNVRSDHTNIHTLIGELNTKLTGVTSNIEKEFLAAYRVHMLELQSELKELKLKVLKSEEELANDGQVAKLEHEVSWFSGESLRLKTHAANMKRDLNHIVMRNDALRNQCQFLSDQLKACMKRSRVLEAEIELAVKDQEFYNYKCFDNNIKPLSSEGRVQSPLGALHAVQSLPALQDNRNILPIRSHSTKTLKKSSSNKLLKKTKIIIDNPAQNDIMIATTDNLSKKLSKLSTTNINETSMTKLHNLLTSRSSTEVDMEKAVQDQWNVIVRRRSEAAKYKTAKILKAFAKNPNANDLETKNILAGGITGLGLEHFTDSDRFALMIRFLSNPVQFQKVVEHMLSNYTSN